MNAYKHFSDAYDQLMADAPYEKWQAFFQDALQKYHVSPQQIVDIGCGTGTLSLFFSELGMDVYAIDPSPEMLMRAQQKYSLQPKDASRGDLLFLETDAAHLELPKPVELAVSFCDSLSYVTDEEELAASFVAVYDSLVNGGIFLFDMHTPYKITDVYGDSMFYESFDEYTYIWETLVDASLYTVDHYLTFFVREKSGLFQKLEETHQQRGYQAERILQLLKKAGFSQIEVFGDFEWESPSPTCERYFFVARRE